MGERAVKHVRKFLGQRLRALRKQRALSQERLGHRSGLSGKFIGEVERGEKSISIDSLYRVSVALEIPLRELTDVRADKPSAVPSEEAEKIFALVSGRRARRIVAAVETELLTPAGLRSLTPQHSSYVPCYSGAPAIRDAAYHQGTVWPWLFGPFVEAWVRAHGDCAGTRARARKRFLEPFMEWHLGATGRSHIAEIADAEAPFTSRGCPFQAWSLGECLRLDRVVLSGSVPGAGCPAPGTLDPAARS